VYVIPYIETKWRNKSEKLFRSTVSIIKNQKEYISYGLFPQVIPKQWDLLAYFKDVTCLDRAVGFQDTESWRTLIMCSWASDH